MFGFANSYIIFIIGIIIMTIGEILITINQGTFIANNTPSSQEEELALYYL
ncbi:hypothetical protein H477_5647 [[Clostridium] sordellii ATCC 9714]|nr:hypothetical protein H477_5647 [[Clostridium] sordellii ATCC 9714] [Paeniclostridium sordellii ATCC 9714]